MSFDICNRQMVTPTTAHRLPETPENTALIERLLELGVSSLSFLMPEDELAHIAPNNDAGIAYDDLIMHLPPSVRNELFPASTPTCKQRSFLRWTRQFNQPQTLMHRPHFDLDKNIDDSLFYFSASSSDRMSYRDCFEGIVGLGKIGSGKTSAFKTLARSFLKSGMGGLVLCVKPEEADFFRDIARQTGREDDVLEFGPGKGSFNFVTYEASQFSEVPINNLVGILLDAANVIDGKIKSDFWDKAAQALLRSLMTILYCAKKRIDLNDLYTCMSAMPKGVDQAAQVEWKSLSPLFARIQEIQHEHPDVAASLHYVMEEWGQLDPKQTSSIQMTLATLLDVLRRAPLQTLLCGDTTVTPDDCRNGKIVILDMAIKDYGDAGKMAQVIFKSAAMRAWERKPGYPVFLWSDECQNTTTPYDALFASTMRSSRTIYVAMTQNLPLWYSNVGDGNARNMVLGFLGSLSTKVFFLNDDAETNNYAADLIGKELVRKKSNSHSSNAGGSSRSTSYSESLEYKVSPDDFKQLRSGGKPNKYIVTGYVYKAGKKWRTGKDFLKASFNQKIGEPFQGAMPFMVKLLVGFFAAAIVLILQLFGLIPSATDLLGSVPVHTQHEADTINSVLPYTYPLFPVLIGCAVMVWLVMQDPEHAREADFPEKRHR